MTVDEALEIVETALDYDCLNQIQEIVFRQSWEGRSYKEIAASSEYEYDYIRDAGAKLWQQLSKALGEKVKKGNLPSVIKRYLRRNQVNVNGNQVIAVNLSGASISGARLLFTNLNAASCNADLCGSIMSDDRIESNKENKSSEDEQNQEIQPYSENTINWNGFCFHSDAQLKIAETLDRTSTLFIPNSQLRLATPDGRQNLEADFLIFHQGKLGLLKIDGETFDRTETDEETGDTADATIRDRPFLDSGVFLVKHYEAIQCSEQPDLVVQDFLETLSQAQA
jgi:hypothetical protein